MKPKFITIWISLWLYLWSANIAKSQAPTYTENIGFPMGQTCNGVIYGNSKYLALDSRGNVYSSTDGETWAYSGYTGNSTSRRIAYGNNLFVVVGNNGFVASSPDGVTWTTRTSGTSSNLSEVKYVNNVFIAAGQNRTAIKSSDGETWSSISIGAGNSTDYFMTITYGNNLYVLSARNSGGASASYSYYSSNLTTWSKSVISEFYTTNGIQFLKNKFFNFHSGTQVYTSTNASSWTDITSTSVSLPGGGSTNLGNYTGNGPYNQMFRGIYDGTNIYLYGSTQSNGYGSIFKSSDGSSFSMLPFSKSIVDQNASFTGNKYFQAGNEGLAYSNDGQNYQFPGGNLNEVASDGTNIYIAGGISTEGFILYGSGIQSLTKATIPSDTKPLRSILYDGTKYFAVGEGEFLISNDGSNWTRSFSTTDTYSNILYNNGKYFLTGYDSGYNPFIKYSVDGVNWTIVNSDLMEIFQIKYLNGLYIATGYEYTNYTGVIYTSADGQTWTNSTPNIGITTGEFSDVIWDGNKYHFFGTKVLSINPTYIYEFFSVASTNPTNLNSYGSVNTITSPPSGTKLGPNYGTGTFRYFNGQIFGIINDIDYSINKAYLVYSSDGSNWNYQAMNNTSGFVGSALHNNDLIYVGSGNGKVLFPGPVVTPSISTATYDASTGILNITAANLSASSGANNDIDVSKLSITGEGSTSYTLTSANVEITNATSFTITLNATDKENINKILNKNGTASTSSTTYNLAAAANWLSASTGNADLSANAITVSNVAIPSITSATYDANSGVLAVSASNLLSLSGNSNDINVSKLTILGQASNTYTLTSTSVEISSSSSFSVTLNTTDKNALASILNKNGNSSIDNTTYNLAAAEDWNPGADQNTTIADLTSNAITVSNVISASAPTVTTNTQTNVTATTATLGGNVTADGGATVSENGIVWATSTNPTTANNKVAIGTGTGAFSQSITGLPANTTIYARAYATNSAGTAYGSQISFTTLTNPCAVIGNNRVNIDVSTNNATFSSISKIGTDKLLIRWRNVTALTNKFEIVNADNTITPFPSYTVSPRTNDNSDTFVFKGLSNGNILICWYSGSSSKGFTDTYFKIIDISGNEILGATKINTLAGELNRFTKVEQLSNGNILFTWATDGSNYSMRRFTQLGVAVDAAQISLTSLAGLTGQSQYAYNIAANANGRFMIFIDYYSLLYKGMIFDNNGTTPIQVGGSNAFTAAVAGTSGVHVDKTPHIKTLSNGKFLLVYRKQPTSETSSRSMAYKIYNDDGTVFKDEVVVRTIHSWGSISEPIIFSSGFIVNYSYNDLNNSPGLGLVRYLEYYDTAGNLNSDFANCLPALNNTSGSRTPFDDVDGSMGIVMRDTEGSTDYNIWLLRGGTTFNSASAPTVTTDTQTNVTATTATLGGNVSADGGATVSENGIVWATSANPTTANNKVAIGTGTGAFSQSITGLPANTTIYVRAYATNSAGTAYGSQISFTTLSAGVLLSSNPTLSFSNNTGFGDNIANDGDGGSNTISDFDIQILAINNSGVHLTSSPLQYHDGTESAWSGYPAIITFGDSPAHYGWSIKSSNGNEFALKSLNFLDWGSFSGNTFVAEAFKDGSSLGTITFTGNTTSAYIPLSSNTNLSSSFQNTDEVRIYEQGGANSWIALNDIQVGPAVVPPSINSATYDASTGILNITAANLSASSGTNNDIDVSKLSIIGEGSTSYTLTSANVEITNATSFTITLNATDKENINKILNKNGTASTSGTTYNLAAAANWLSASTGNADLSANAITVSNVAIPSITSATYDANSGVLAVSASNLLSLSGNSNDINISKLTILGQASNTYTLTSTSVEISSSSSFSVTLNTTDKNALASILNKNGNSSIDNTTYNLAAAEDWNPGADQNTTIADLTSNAITVSNVISASAPTVTTNTQTNVTATTATLGGNVTADGGATVSENGIVWATSTNPTTANNKVAIGTGTGAFSQSITGLPANTTIYVRAYATNSAGTAYGSQISFTTCSLAPTITPPANLVVCSPNTLTLTAAGCNGTVNWSNASTGNTLTLSNTGTYSISATCTVNGCTSASSTAIALEIKAKPNAPTITPPANLSVCSPSTLTLTAAGCNGTVNWSNGSTGNTLTLSNTGTYSISATCTVNGCTSDASSTLTGLEIKARPNAPTITPPANLSVCSPSTLTLTAAGCNGTVNWSNASTGNTLTLSNTGTYSISATCTVNGCTSASSTAIALEIKAKPNAPTITPPANLSVCSPSTLTLTAAGCNGTVNWSNGSTGNTLTLSNTGTYSISATCTINGCTSDASSTLTGLEIKARPNAPTITPPANLVVCSPNTLTLTAAGCNGTVNWSNASTGNTLTLSNTGTYSISATCTVNGCTSASSTAIALEIKAKPNAPTITPPANLSVCSPSTLTLTAAGCNGTVNWSNASTGNTLTLSNTGTYSISATCTVNGCTSASSTAIALEIKAKPNAPTITPPANLSVCSPSTLTLTAAGCNGTVNWSNGSTGNTLTLSNTGTYSISATCTINGCTSDASSTLTGLEIKARPNAPTITPPANLSVCSPNTLTLTAAGCNGTVNWSNASTGNTLTLSNTGTYSISATCTVNGCTSASSTAIALEIKAKPNAPTITPPANLSVCSPSTLTLTAAGCNGTVNWSNGSTGNTLTLSNTGTYSISATCTINGCTSDASSTLTGLEIKARPNAPTITPPANLVVCSPNTLTLTAAGCNGTVNWSNASTGNTLTLSNTGTYSISATCTVNGCTSASSTAIALEIKAKPNAPTITPPANLSVCSPSTLTLTAAGCNGTVNWSNGSTGNTLTLSNTGTYSISATCTVNGCTSDASSTLTGLEIKARPNAPTITPPANLSVCSPDTLTLSATGCTGTITWSNGSTGENLKLFSVGNYNITATCTSTNGCTSSNSAVVAVQIKAKPNAPTITPPTSLNVCSPSTLNLTATGCNGTITWSNGSTGSSLTLSNIDSYEIFAICQDINGCTSINSDTLQLNIYDLPSATISTNSPLCPSNTLQLNALGGSSYSWNGPNGFTSTLANPSINNIGQANIGSYTVIVTDLNGCSASASTSISLSSITATASNTGPYLVGQTIQLSATGGSTYKWSGPNGFTSTSANPNIPNALLNASGIYTVIANDNGCTDTKTTSVVVSGTNPCNPQRIMDYSFVKAGDPYSDLFPLTNGMKINQMNQELSILVKPVCDSIKIESVEMNITGPQMNWNLIESVEPFALFSNLGSVVYGRNFTPGTYNLTITGYSQDGKKGIKNYGPVVTTFTVVGNLATINAPTVSDTTICAGANITVNFSTTGSFSTGNQFRVELSDSSGTFTKPIIIGTSNQVGTISCKIPLNTFEGSKYLIRVSSTDQVIASNPALKFIKIHPYLYKFNQDLSGTNVIKAVHTIDASNKIISPGSTNYKAGSAIILNPGFDSNDGVFIAEIEACNNN